MTSSRRLAAGAALALTAILAAPAFAAYICHPDPPGTRTLALQGAVERFTLAGSTVSVAVRTGRHCDVLAWDIRTGIHRTTGTGCSAIAPRSLSAPSPEQALIHPATATSPETLDVFRGTQRIASWPLPVHVRSVRVSGDYAVFAGRDGGAYALRLSDGRVAALGPAVAGDVPQVGHLGAVFAARKAYSNAEDVTMKFVPTSGMGMEVDQAARPIGTTGSIRSVAMDGPRVALAVRDQQGRCDEVLYWNVLRAPLQRISAPEGPTCVPGRPASISSVAIGGFRTEWLAGAGSRSSIVVGSPLCQEWVVRRLARGPGGDDVVAMAADGKTLAFAVTHHERELRGLATVDVVVGRYTPRTIVTGRGQPVALAVDGSRVATAFADGSVEIRNAAGQPLARLNVGSTRAIALGAGRLVVLRAARLDVYGVSSGRLLRSMAIPHASVDAIDVQYGIAVLASGRDAVAVDLETGRTAVVGTAATPLVATAIERPGVVLASNRAGRGAGGFVPLARVEAMLGRA